MKPNELWKEFLQLREMDNLPRILQREQMCITVANFDKLLNWMYQVSGFCAVGSYWLSPLLPYVGLTFQHLAEMDCSRPTKYLARSYLAIYLHSTAAIGVHQLQLLSGTAIILAVRLNESFNYPLQLAIQSTGTQYSREDFVRAQQRMLIALSFRTQFTTPYCYLTHLKERLPNFQKEFWDGLELVLEYASMLPKLSHCSSLVLLLGVFLFMSGHTDSISDEIQPLVMVAADPKQVLSVSKYIALQLQSDAPTGAGSSGAKASHQ